MILVVLQVVQLRRWALVLSIGKFKQDTVVVVASVHLFVVLVHPVHDAVADQVWREFIGFYNRHLCVDDVVLH